MRIIIMSSLIIKCSNNCGNSLATYTSIDNNGDLIGKGFYGAECTNCCNVKVVKERKATALYVASNYNNEIMEDVKSMQRLSFNKIKALKENDDFWYLTDCISRKSYRVYVNNYDRKIELTEFNPYER